MKSKQAKEKARAAKPVAAESKAVQALPVAAAQLLNTLGQVRGAQRENESALSTLSVQAQDLVDEIEKQGIELGDGVALRLALLDGDVLIGNLSIGAKGGVQSLTADQLIDLGRWIREQVGE